VIKPAHGGGGKGVVLHASTWDQVLAARQEYPSDEYLVQAQISPAVLDGRPAWFRIIFCAGKIFPCWWHPCTHVYTPLTDSERERFGLQPLESIARVMARLSQLELFSTEIAFTPSGCFYVIDYINDPVDLRLQSKAAEGVPDGIVEDIACRITDFVTARCDTFYAYS